MNLNALCTLPYIRKKKTFVTWLFILLQVWVVLQFLSYSREVYQGRDPNHDDLSELNEFCKLYPQICDKRGYKFTKFLYLFYDSYPIDHFLPIFTQFGYLKNHSLVYSINLPSHLNSYALYSSFWTGRMPLNIEGHRLKSDNIFEQFKSAGINMTYVGYPSPTLKLLGDEGDLSHYFQPSNVDKDSIDAIFESLNQEQVDQYIESFVGKDKKQSLLAVTGFLDAAYPKWGDKNHPNNLKTVEILRQNLEKVMNWVSRNPEYLLIVNSDHGGWEASHPTYTHGRKDSGNQPVLFFYNPTLKPDPTEPGTEWLNAVDVASTISEKFLGVSIPYCSIGKIRKNLKTDTETATLENALQLKQLAIRRKTKKVNYQLFSEGIEMNHTVPVLRDLSKAQKFIDDASQKMHSRSLSFTIFYPIILVLVLINQIMQWKAMHKTLDSAITHLKNGSLILDLFPYVNLLFIYSRHWQIPMAGVPVLLFVLLTRVSRSYFNMLVGGVILWFTQSFLNFMTLKDIALTPLLTSVPILNFFAIYFVQIWRVLITKEERIFYAFILLFVKIGIKGEEDAVLWLMWIVYVSIFLHLSFLLVKNRLHDLMIPVLVFLFILSTDTERFYMVFLLIPQYHIITQAFRHPFSEPQQTKLEDYMEEMVRVDNGNNTVNYAPVDDDEEKVHTKRSNIEREGNLFSEYQLLGLILPLLFFVASDTFDTLNSFHIMDVRVQATYYAVPNPGEYATISGVFMGIHKVGFFLLAVPFLLDITHKVNSRTFFVSRYMLTSALLNIGAFFWKFGYHFTEPCFIAAGIVIVYSLAYVFGIALNRIIEEIKVFISHRMNRIKL